ncbi:potassium voltage-gated channel subfamily KQT member 1-like isoform X2 [Dermatophagoides pteronyssinus]|uniref:potassium voltage-gated channel subfamily KQT member 1-like isoform X2 n=1 Tax=Dermatophagoides pteronyssinus TaxID=6956 RepID=UPI003F6655F0
MFISILRKKFLKVKILSFKNLQSMNGKLDPSKMINDDDNDEQVKDVENYAANSLPTKKTSMPKTNHHHRSNHHNHDHRPLLIPYMPKRIIVYNFLRRPNNFHAIMYHVSLIILIIISLLCFAVATIPELTESIRPISIIFDSLICMFVIGESVAIYWSSSCQPKYQGINGRLRFLRSFSGLFDIMILFVTLTIAYCHYTDHKFYTVNDKYWLFLRLGQWLHILRMGERFKPWLWLIFVTFVMFLAEQTQNQTDFTSLPKTFWWSIVSLFTIGYGDMTPATNLGKVLASIFFFLFIFKFALPAGVLSTGLALKIQEQQRCRHISQRRLAAVRFIKLAWRYFHYRKHEHAAVFSRRKRYSTMNNNNNNNDVQRINPPEIVCIRFIITLQFLLARRRFRRAMRPYDFGDIMEQYTVGHEELICQVDRLYLQIDRLEKQIKQNQEILEIVEQQTKLTAKILENKFEKFKVSKISTIENDQNKIESHER